MIAPPRSLDHLVADLRIWLHAGTKCSGGMTVEDFGFPMFEAGCWCIQCVGEAAGKLLQAYPDFPDDDLRKELVLANAARNRLTHGYYDLSREQVWQTLETSFPKLLALLDAQIARRQG